MEGGGRARARRRGVLPPQTSEVERQLREACAELDRDLRDGRPARVEQCFAARPALAASADAAVELIYLEFATREELGQRPTADEYYLRFPWWRPALQRQLAIHDWLRDGGEGPAPAGGGGGRPPPGGGPPGR